VDQFELGGRLARPGGPCRVELGAGIADPVDVELDLQPAAHPEARGIEPGQRALQHAARVQLHRAAVL
jgi:hypothetical protein